MPEGRSAPLHVAQRGRPAQTFESPVGERPEVISAIANAIAR
jgi:hypothetical protein